MLLVDRLLDYLASRVDAGGRRNGGSNTELECPAIAPGMVEMGPIPAGKASPDDFVSQLMTERESSRHSGELGAMRD